jgi:DMATS type aromatic prenyltransferase
MSLSWHPNAVSVPVPEPRTHDHGAFAERKLSLLCQGLGTSARFTREFARVFRLMSRSWSDWPLGSRPAWSSDITDDGTPFEFSVAFDGKRPKLRLLVESQEAPMTATSTWNAGLRLNDLLNQTYDADLARFEHVRDLFAPAQDMPARFFLWHAAVLEEGLPPSFKAYMNPQVHGSHASQSVVLKALARLNMDGAAGFFVSRSSSCQHDRFLYFSLDLAAGSSARVKVYVAQPGATADQIERALDGTGNYVRGEATEWIHQLLGAGSGPFEDRPLLVCYSFTSSGEPPLATVHLPVRSYTKDDEDSLERTRKYLSAKDGQTLRSALRLFADRPLSTGRGLFTYTSLRRLPDGLSVTGYFAPEAFAVFPPRASTPTGRR